MDFHYNGVDYSIPGESQILLSELIEIISITKEDGSLLDISEVKRVAFTDVHLVSVEQVSGVISYNGVENVNVGEKDFLLTSLEPFTTDEYLTIVLNDGTELFVGVTDAQHVVTDISDLLTEATINAPQENGHYVVYENETYSLHLAFKENPNGGQFNMDTGFSYTLPDGIVPSNESKQGTIYITLAGGENPGAKVPLAYSFSTGADGKAVMNFTWPEKDTPEFTQLANGIYAGFTVDIVGQITKNVEEFTFNSSITKDVEVKTGGKTHVSKSGNYNPATNCVDYEVTVRSEGVTEQVVVQDTISGSALSYNGDAKGTSTKGTEYTPTTSGNGFTLTIPKMSDGEQVTIKYSASVNLSGITDVDGVLGGSVQQTGNKVTVSSDTPDDPGDEDEKTGRDFNNKISYSTISKTGTVEDTDDTGHATATWTIKANEYANVSMAGHTISDEIIDGSPMTYSGYGIYVLRKDSNGNVVGAAAPGELIRWENLNKTATSWSWSVPNQYPDTGNLFYEITYTTDVDVSNKLFNTQVKNKGTSDNGGSSNAGVDVKPAGGGLTARKQVISKDLSNQVITWEISFDVPANGLDSAEIVDTLPMLWGNNVVKYYDAYKADSIVITPALAAGEDYTVEEFVDENDNNKHKVRIAFNKLVDGVQQPGLTGTGSKRKLRVQLQTELNEDWLTEAETNTDALSHTNDAQVILNGQYLSTSATTQVDMKKPGMSKINGVSTTAWVNGNTVPVFEYTILLTGLTDEAFDENGQIILTDTYNGRYLRFNEDFPQAPQIAEQNGYLYGSGVTVVNDGSTVKGPYVAQQAGEGKLKFVINMSDLTIDNGLLNSDGSYKPYYFVHYYLTVKDKITYDKLLNDASDADGGKVKLYNTVTNDYFGEETNVVDYQVPVITKESTDAYWNADTGKWQVNYTITVNNDGLQLGDEDELTLTDDYTNIAIDYTTIRIVPSEGASWNRKGHSITYTLQNGRKYVITYTATIYGTPNDEGKVTYSNTAEVFGVKKTVSKEQNLNITGGGDSPNYNIKVFKHVKGGSSEALEGAVFDLYMYSVEDVSDPSRMDYADGYLTRPDENAAGWTKVKTGIRTDENGEWSSTSEDALHSQTWYRLVETQAPTKDGITYKLKDFSYYFWITLGTAPDYDNYIFLNNDVVAIDNEPPTPETIDVSVTKAWTVDPDADHAPVTVHLYADGEPIEDHLDKNGQHDIVRGDGTQVLGVGGDWDYTWEGLPGGPVYTVVEDSVPGYVTTYSPKKLQNTGTITVRNKKLEEKTFIKVHKVWANGVKPTDDVTIQLKRNLSANASIVFANYEGVYWDSESVPVGSIVTISYQGWEGPGTSKLGSILRRGSYPGTQIQELESGSWEYNETEGYFLMQYKDIEVTNEGLTLTFPNGGISSLSQFYIPPYIEITGTTGSGEASEDINYTNECHYYTLDADHNWELTIDRLPLSDSDGSYTYFIEEIGVNDNSETPSDAGYVVTYSANNDEGVTGDTVTVTNKADTVEAEFIKNWVNADGSAVDGIDNRINLRVQAQLERWYVNEGGDIVKETDVGEPVTLYGDRSSFTGGPDNYSETTSIAHGEKWSAKWTDLPKKGTVNGVTVDYIYRVVEKKVYPVDTIDPNANDLMKMNVYTSETRYAVDAESGKHTTTTTNTFPVVNIDVEKKWQKDQDGTPVDATPDEGVTVTVQLQRKERTISADRASDGSWSDWADVSGKTLTLTSSNWNDRFEGLPVYGTRTEAGAPSGFAIVEYDYRVVETGVTINNEPSEKHYTTAIDVRNVGQNDKSVTITNTETEPQSGSLALSKVVAAAVGSTLPDGYADQEFTFTVALTNANGLPETVPVTIVKKSDGSEITAKQNYPVTSGAVTVTLKDGQKALIENLPLDTTYSVSEASVAGYELSWNETNGATGTISTTAISAEATNTFTSAEYTPLVNKMLNGTAFTGKLDDGETEASFTFDLKAMAVSGEVGNETYTVAETATQSKTTGTDGTVTFDAISYNAPGTYYYEISEQGTDTDAMDYDGKKVYLKVVVANDLKTVTGTYWLDQACTASTAGESATFNNTELIKIETTKEWKSGTQDMAWPEDVQSVTFTLYAKVGDGEAAEVAPEDHSEWIGITASQTISATDTEKKAVWSRLPKKVKVNDTMTAVEYSVVETGVTYYTTAGKAALTTAADVADAYGAAYADGKITNIPVTSVAGTKTWNTTLAHDDPILKLTRTYVDSSNESHTETVKGSGEGNRTYNMAGANDLQPEWSGTGYYNRTYTYSDLPQYTANGEKYTYEVAETSFTVTTKDKDGNVIKTYSYTVAKGADDKWEVTCTSAEGNPPEFVFAEKLNETNGMDFSNSELTTKTVTKVWETGIENDSNIQSITYELTRTLPKNQSFEVDDNYKRTVTIKKTENGYNVKETNKNGDTLKDVNLTGEVKWGYAWEGLELYKYLFIQEAGQGSASGADIGEAGNQKTYSYIVRETGFTYDNVDYEVNYVNGTPSSVTAKTEGGTQHLFVTTYDEDKEIFTNTLNETHIDVNKKWWSMDGREYPAAGLTGKQITLTLYRMKKAESGTSAQESPADFTTFTLDGVADTETTALTPLTGTAQETSAWVAKFDGLPLTGVEDGVSYTYSYYVIEAQVAGFDAPVYTDENVDTFPTTVKQKTPETQLVVRDNTGKTVYIHNKETQSYALPSTGGAGTTGFYVLGSILTLLALVLLVTKKRSDGAGIE